MCLSAFATSDKEGIHRSRETARLRITLKVFQKYRILKGRCPLHSVFHGTTIRKTIRLCAISFNGKPLFRFCDYTNPLNKSQDAKRYTSRHLR